MAKYEDKDSVKCSFCGKSQDMVNRIVAGPGVFICNECVNVCLDILKEELGVYSEAQGQTDATGINLYKPHEIKEYLPLKA